VEFFASAGTAGTAMVATKQTKITRAIRIPGPPSRSAAIPVVNYGDFWAVICTVTGIRMVDPGADQQKKRIRYQR
jgi:hypothetical protein